MCKIRKMGDNHNISEKNQSDDELEAPVLNEQEEDITEEYENLNTTLDQLESCLDILEQQNDSLFAKLQALLEETQENSQEEGEKICEGGMNEATENSSTTEVTMGNQDRVHSNQETLNSQSTQPMDQ